MRRLLSFTLFVAMLAGNGCGGSGRPATGPTRPLPTYAGRSANLFDDQIEPAALGVDLIDRGDPRLEPSFRERIRSSDAILRVRVDTITGRAEGASSVYHLGVSTVERLGGKHAPADPFTLVVGRDSGGLVRSFEGALVGKSFVAFVRQFVRPDGDSELHFHFAADSKPVVAAVREAVILDEVK